MSALCYHTIDESSEEEYTAFSEFALKRCMLAIAETRRKEFGVSIFGDLDIGDIQEMLFPMVKSLTGLDIQGHVSDKSVALDIAGDELIKIGEFVKLAAASVSDGILDSDELNALIASAPDINSAVALIKDVLFGTPVVVN